MTDTKHDQGKPPASVAWVDADEAIIWRWQDGAAQHIARLESGVPSHHKSVGHVRQGAGHHGGSGPRSAQEGHRLEHLRSYLAQVEATLPAGDDLLLLGDGPVVEHLAGLIREDDTKHRRERRLELAHSMPLSERQLLARLRTFAGDPPARRLPRGQ